MKKQHLRWLAAAALLAPTGSAATAQTEYEPYGPQPEVGKPMPAFALDDVDYYPRASATLDDFQGRWLVLDFWAAWCAPCVKAFPKLSELQKRFEDRVQVLLIGIHGPHSNSREANRRTYRGLREKQDLVLPVAYDSELYLRWGIWSVPHYIVIDDEGVVRARAGTEVVDELEALLDGDSSHIDGDREHASAPFDGTKLLLVDGNGGEARAFMFRSILAKNTSRQTYFPLEIETVTIEGKPTFQVSMAPLSSLYKYAYFGTFDWSSSLEHPLYARVYPLPIFEMSESTDFEYDFRSGKGLYDYSLSVPDSYSGDSRFLMEVMRRDLKSYFGYDATVEVRRMPYWKLIVESKAAANRLRTKGGNGGYPEATVAGFALRNAPIEMLLNVVNYYYVQEGLPFVNETEIDHDIDIIVDALMTNFDDVREALRKSGLDLVEGKKKMEVLVIRETDEARANAREHGEAN